MVKVALGCFLSECRFTAPMLLLIRSSCQSIFDSPSMGYYRLLLLLIAGVVVFLVIIDCDQLLSVVTFHCSLSIIIDASVSYS